MLLKFILIFLSLSISQCVLAQIDPKILEQQVLEQNQINSFKTLVINAASLAPQVISDFKSELLNWHEKVITINYDQQHLRLVIKHNLLLHPREMTDVLFKYNISNDKIISYQ